jgi:UDP-N-acetylglucosamine:LPS N-acetylglucosamine transferase
LYKCIRAFNKEVAIQLPVVASGFDIETELTLQMLYKHFIIKEITIPYRARPQESYSKLSTFKDGWKMFLKILEILRSYKPLTFFGTVSILCEIIALGYGILIISSFNQRQDVSFIPIVICSTLFIIGIFFVSMGIILNSLNFRLMEIMSALEKQIYWINKDKNE